MLTRFMTPIAIGLMVALTASFAAACNCGASAAPGIAAPSISGYAPAASTLVLFGLRGRSLT